jgi:hypothetical protein
LEDRGSSFIGDAGAAEVSVRRLTFGSRAWAGGAGTRSGEARESLPVAL